jgi:hypothetical protein
MEMEDARAAAEGSGGRISLSWLGGARSPLGLGTFAAVNVIGTNRTLVAAPRSVAWRTRLLLGLDCGEQLLHGALRRRTERFVQMNRLCKLLADEIIALREFGVAGKCSLDEIGLAAA